MKKFLSALLAVVMVVAMLPTGIAFAADGDNTDIVFDFVASVKQVEADGVTFAGSGYTDTFSVNTALVEYMPEGIAVSSSTLGLQANSIRWHKGSGIRMCNHYADWITQTGVGRANKFLFDITISAEQAGWYRPSIKLQASTPAANVYANYMMSGTEIKYLGDVSCAEGMNNNQLNPVYLAEGTHTLVMACYAPGNGQPTTYISSITLHAVNETPTVVASSVTAPETLEVGTTGTVDASALTLSDAVASYELATYAMNANAVYAGASTVDYIKVTSSNQYVATVAKTDATTSKITPLHEGTTTLTITPVVGGVEQTAMAATKTLTVTDPTNIKFDFDEFSTLFVSADAATDEKPIAKHQAISSTPLLANFAVVDTTNGATPIWQPSGGGIRYRATGANWLATDRYNDKIVLDIEVAAGKAGWYTPFVSFSGNHEATTSEPKVAASVYHVANGKANFLGDAATGQTYLNPVYLEEGTNKIVFAGISKATYSAYIYKLYFNKLAAAPTFSAPAIADLPETVAIDETVVATASVSIGEKAYQLEEAGMNTSNFFKTAEKATYIKVASSVEGIVEVSDPVVSGVNNKTTASFSVKGLKAGTTTLTFTPVINGVEKAELATTKTVNVKALNLSYNLRFSQETIEGKYGAEAWGVANKTYTVLFSAMGSLKDIMPEGLTLSSINGINELRWQTNTALRFGNHNADWATNGGNKNHIAFDIAIGAGAEGWYRPNIELDLGLPNGQNFYAYMISGDEVKYLGNINALGKRLNPIYLEEGTYTLLLGCYSKTTNGQPTTYISAVNLYRCEGAPVVKEFEASIPSAVQLNSTGTVSMTTLKLTDEGSYDFAEYAANTDGTSAGRNTTDMNNYMLVESSEPSVATVVRVDAKTWRIKPVREGTTTITATPIINGVAQAPVQTKTVMVTYPNESLSGSQNIIVDAVVGNAGEYDTTGLIDTNGIAVGSVTPVAVGSTVTLTANSTDDLAFLYWYNGNTKKILSDQETYSFEVGTKGAIYAKYASTSGELVEYASAAGQLVDESYTEFGSNFREVGDYYTLYAEEIDETNVEEVEETNENAVYWTKDGEIVSYDTTYSYYPWTGEEVVSAVTEGEKSDVPAVVLFENGNARMLELVNFDGVEILEKGILFGESSANVNSFSTKAVSTTDAKQFTASSDLTYARAYVIYKDGTSYRVAYSD